MAGKERGPLLIARRRVVGARRDLYDRWYDEGWYSNETMLDALRAGAVRWPLLDVVFETTRGRQSLALRDALARAERVAAGLYRMGVRPDDVVAVQLPNWPETLVIYAAVFRLGATLLPIVHIYGPAETGFILDRSGARAFVVPDRWESIDYLDRLEKMPPLPSLKGVVVVGEKMPPWATPYRSLLADEGDAPEPSTGVESRCLLLYTSGTTAEPKGVQHSHNSFLTEMRTLPTPPRGIPGTVSLQPFPAGHIGGATALLAPFVHGVPTYMMDRWSADTAFELVVDAGITAMAGTPFHISGLLNIAEASDRPVALRQVMTGGAGVPPTLVERADRIGWQVVRCYGSSEHPSATTSRYDDPLAERARSDGRPINGSEVRIDANGEVLLIGPEQFLGYTDRARNDESFTDDGWFRTGDVGVVADGRLTITDRIKDIIIRGGENISSSEVEAALAAHPAIVEAAVVPMPDERYGERVCAFVIVRPGASIDLVALRAWIVESGLAVQKTPEMLIVVDELPRTPAGKVKKYELRPPVTN